MSSKIDIPSTQQNTLQTLLANIANKASANITVHFVEFLA